ncbi:MAG: peptidylprolyl isomerase [Polyangiaceae bacterium]
MRRRAPRRFRLAVLALSLVGCASEAVSTSGAPGASASGAAAAPSTDPNKLLELRRAEQRRSARGVSADAQNDRDPVVRRRAARALARIATPAARPGLLRALSDADEETIAWAAYGLGMSCADDREETVSVLAARSLTVPESSTARLGALENIARAIGRCASDTTTEATLHAWLGGSRARARAAALGLGDFVGLKKRLREDTIATLLNLAAGSPSSPAMVEAIFPISRIESLPNSVVTRAVEVGVMLLAAPSTLRILAVRALGRTRSEAAVSALEKVVATASSGGADGYSAEERVEAVRALQRIGPSGLAAITRAIAAGPPTAEAIADGGPAYDVLLTELGALIEAGDAKAALGTLAALTPAGATASGRRRTTAIRCAAASILAGSNVTDPALLACDLDKGSAGTRALVGVLGKADIEGPRLTLWTTLARSKDPRTREAAIGLIPSHGELSNTWELLAEALEAPESGVVEAAAEVLTAFPDEGAPAPKKMKKKAPKEGDKEKEKGKERDRPKPKAGVPPLEPQKRIVDALEKALERSEKDLDEELEIGVIDALGALQRRSFEPKLLGLCASTYPAIREHAATALGSITGAKHPCPAPDVAGPDPPELEAPESSVTIVFDTDAGELKLVLDGELAPVTVARFADLVRSGYYDGNVLHRVDPAFVVQWGSPWADSTGGPPGRQPLRCETTPLPFERFKVGVALSGRDTGSSQFFVTRSHAPHLDGQYGLIGAAEGPWDRVSEGDVIRKATVR